ncbi:MAG TPA: type II secretion system protein GspE, partial [Parvularcula sp.]|nr:type II secretion system protein GspE [Parvularcula sp.]
TIHTNSAASTVTRLIDMGVEEYLIGSCASAFVAQRLVGVLCRHCVGAAPAPAAIFERFGLDPGGAAVV